MESVKSDHTVGSTKFNGTIHETVVQDDPFIDLVENTLKKPDFIHLASP